MAIGAIFQRRGGWIVADEIEDPRLPFVLMMRLKSYEARSLFLMADNYLRGLALCIDRREAALAAPVESQGELDPEAAMRRGVSLFADAHFAIVCADKVARMLRRISDRESDEMIRALADDSRPFFRAITKARNHFEHLDERTDTHGMEIGKFYGTVWMFGELRLDLGWALHEKLLGLFLSLLSILASRDTDS